MPAEFLPEGRTALSTVPTAGSRHGQVPVGTVKFFYGPMDCGKSTLALQLDHNHSRQGRRGLLLTRLDRSHRGQITSRMGISRPAIEVDDDVDLAELVRISWAAGRRVDYLIVDEAQFFTPVQIDQLARLADDVAVDVYAFGIATDFRGRLFPGSTRLFELADEVLLLQVEVLCWCGAPGRLLRPRRPGRRRGRGHPGRADTGRQHRARRRRCPLSGALPAPPSFRRSRPAVRQPPAALGSVHLTAVTWVL